METRLHRRVRERFHLAPYKAAPAFFLHAKLAPMSQIFRERELYNYGDDPDNLRIYYRDASNAETIYFYGANGPEAGDLHLLDRHL